MYHASYTPKREGAPLSGVKILAWLLMAIGAAALCLSLVLSLSKPSYKPVPYEDHRKCFIEFTETDARPESDAPPQIELQTSLYGAVIDDAATTMTSPGLQETDEAQVEFALASFATQDSSRRPQPTQTPELAQKRGKRNGMRRLFDWLSGRSSKVLEKPAKRRPSPPRLDASTYSVCLGSEAAARVQITASGFDPSCPPLAYHWRVDSGHVEGRGAKVVWNLRGLPKGKYRATFKADVDPDCYDCRNCDLFGATKVTVQPCATPTPTPTPTVTPTPKPTPKPTPTPYTCPNVYCSSVTRGNSMTFTANVGGGGTPGVSPIYHWSVSAGRISGGQGSSSIQVDTAGLAEGTEINATVEARGYGRVCMTSCKSLVDSFYTPTPKPTPTPSPTPSPSPSPTPYSSQERHTVGVHYASQLTRGYDATISFKWTSSYTARGEQESDGRSSAPRVIPASFQQAADEQPPPGVATLYLHSNDLNPKSWSLKLPLGEERSLTINPANYVERTAFTLEVDALEIDGRLWKRADAGGVLLWRDYSDGGECGPHSFVINVLAPPSPYVPTILLLSGIIALLAGDYLRRLAQSAALKQIEESILAESGAATEGDDVRCTVFAPTEARQGKSFMVIAFAHLAQHAALLAEMAKGMSKSVEQRGPGKKLGAKIERGKELLFSLEMPGLEIDEPNQSLIWEGEPDSVQFGVTIPKDFETGSIIATVRVAYNSVPVGHVKFEFEVVEGAQPAEKLAAAAPATPPAAAPVPFDNFVQYKQVFISYASQDRAEVLKRVQVMSMMKVNFFHDLLTLEPGADWEKTIYRYLDLSDAVFLFWSSHAKRSEWVEKELRYALSRREAPPEIVPIIIEAPAPLPPPDYLKALHFNDKIMYLVKVEEESRARATQPDKY